MRRCAGAGALAATSLAACAMAGIAAAGGADGASADAAIGGGKEAAPSDGAAVFAKNCALCHQSDAAGLVGQYPRLAGRVGHISSKPAGRAYLIDVVTYGMVGMVTVDKQSIVGVMPALQLSDADAAGVLSYVAGLGNAHPTAFTPAEITAQRAQPAKSGADVHAERQTLQSAKIVE